MKPYFKMFLVLIFIILFCNNFSYSEQFESVKGLTATDVFSIVTIGRDHYTVFAGADSTLYKSRKDLDTWDAVFSVKGDESKINHLYFDSKASKLYIATNSGLLKGTFEGFSFEEIFRGRTSKQKNIHFVTTKRGMIYIGTEEGLFYSDKNNIQWEKYGEFPQDIEIFWISFSSNKKTYIATSLGVYEADKNFRHLNRVFYTQKLDISKSSQKVQQEEEYYAFLPQVILVSKNNSEKIYLGTTDGLFISYNGGNTWHRKFITALGRASIHSILQGKKDNIIYVASDKGFFRLNLETKEVTEYYKGLTTNKIHYAIKYKENFLLATNKGLFRSLQDRKIYKVTDRYKEYFKYEPTIREIRQAAIDYNNISSNKIYRWKEKVKKKAWLPELKVGADRNVTDLHYWDTTTASGKDAILRKGEDAVEWDVSLSWDLGDLIWNKDQTSIEIRSRLNTQLRIDLLEELNRIYFQRYRLKLELLSTPPQDAKKRLEKRLRIKELTAKLDSYTGGYFSRRCKELMMSEKK